MKSFEGKHIVITGGSKGIGRATAEVFLREGAKVSILDVDPPTDNISNDQINFFRTDVSKSDQVNKAIVSAIEYFGEIDVLVNNAGIVKYTSVSETTEEDWDAVINTNLKSAFLCAKYAIPSMLRKGGGVIVNVSSVQAFVSQKKVASYTTSKTALLGLTRSIALDYAPHIRCVAVCPGTIDTPMLESVLQRSPDPEAVYNECIEMHPLKKIGSALEVGELIAFLASEKASFITGQAFRIDGGLGIGVGGN
jgi:NAD(P)-dependent dehydrogenase (short-subunit alcohol dehydrogenase family)